MKNLINNIKVRSLSEDEILSINGGGLLEGIAWFYGFGSRLIENQATVQETQTATAPKW